MAIERVVSFYRYLVSVLQMLTAFEKASGAAESYNIMPRRPGDVAQCWAYFQKAHGIGSRMIRKILINDSVV